MTSWKLGIIGGSGLYALDGLENVRSEAVETASFYRAASNARSTCVRCTTW